MLLLAAPVMHAQVLKEAAEAAGESPPELPDEAYTSWCARVGGRDRQESGGSSRHA